MELVTVLESKEKPPCGHKRRENKTVKQKNPTGMKPLNKIQRLYSNGVLDGVR